jgi:prefoldin subunit 5
MNNFTPMLVLDGPFLAGVAGIIVAIGGLLTALGKIVLSVFHEYLTLRDEQADKTIRTMTGEIHTKDLKIRRLERQLAQAAKERAPSS